ncbi:MAG: hypothetical protein IPJ41_16815 [Phycisphaerales bacterium]|nr:hypothetical protein [Phycisphaerales bacterium]
MSKIHTALVLISCCGLLGGCSKEDNTPSNPGTKSGQTGGVGDALKNAGQDVQKSAEDALDQSKKAAEEAAAKAKADLAAKAAEMKAKAVAAAEDELTQLEPKLQELQTKLDAAVPQVKALAQPLMDTAKQQFKAVGDQVTALKAAGADSWESVSKELTSAVEGLRQTVSNLASKLGA